MNHWNKTVDITFGEYMKCAEDSKKDNLVIIRKAPNCNYCYLCHEGVSGGYRVLVKEIILGEAEITEVLVCYGCYSDAMELEKKQKTRSIAP